MNQAHTTSARLPVVLGPGEGRAYPMGRIGAVFKADGAETESRYSVSEWRLEPHTQGPGHIHIPRTISSTSPMDHEFVIGRMGPRDAGFVRSRSRWQVHDFENRSDAPARPQLLRRGASSPTCRISPSGSPRTRLGVKVRGPDRGVPIWPLGRSPMPNLLRNVLAVIAGIVIGGGVNMALITLSPSLIPPPAGVDVNSAESLSKAMHLFEPRHFIMPFLAHAVGTFAGALAAYLIAASYKAHNCLRDWRGFSLRWCGGKFHDSRPNLVHRA